MPTKNLEQFRRIFADKNLIETSRYKKNQSQKAKKEKNFVYNNTKTMALINNEEKCILEPGEFMFQWVDGRKIIKFGLFKLFIEN